MSDLILNQEQEDVLKELINISFGLAASLIGDMLHSYVHLHVPKIEVFDIKELPSLINSKFENSGNYYITKQLFRGGFGGETIFILGRESAYKFSELLIQSQDLEPDDIKSSMLEIANIITSACIGQLNEFILNHVFFEAPIIDVIDLNSSNRVIENHAFDYQNVIVIETTIDLQDANIKGYMFILSDEESFRFLKNALNRIS